jgi:multicomponent Na+:H+ antiporter subunit A
MRITSLTKCWRNLAEVYLLHDVVMMSLPVAVPLLLALTAAPLTLLSGLAGIAWAARASVLLAALTFGATLWVWLTGGGSFNVPWAPAWDLRLHFTLDGLAALYALLASGIGCLVLLYSTRYVPQHLEHDERPQGEAVRFYALMLLFLGSMIGLVMAQDLLLVFVFWDITAIASYYLIGYDAHHDPQSRRSALMALLITGISSVLFLIGAMLLYTVYGTFSIPQLIEQAEAGPLLTTAGLLMAVAALAKSAQVPLHFWLPRAMAAPTPVSAYLHSAAMVAAGVFLLGRLYPLLEPDPVIGQALIGIGVLSMAVGGFLALTRDVLKQVLAYSTIAQYGYVVFLLGMGGKVALEGAAFYVIAHALCKSGLFLTAGAVTEATHEKALSKVGGLRRAMPWLAAGSGVLAAGLAALPLTIGFFKDELFFEAAVERGWPFVGAALLGTVFTLAYIWRFWSGIFLGQTRSEAHPIPLALVAPIVVLAVPVVAGGIFPGLFTPLAADAAAVMRNEPTEFHLAYHLEASATNLLALATYGLGVLLIVARPLWAGAATAIASAASRAGPESWYHALLYWLNRASRRSGTFDIRDLRWRIATILGTTATLIVLSTLVAPPAFAGLLTGIRAADLPLMLGLALVIIATLTVLVPRNLFTLVLALSSVGYGLAAVYAFFGGPDVALVAVLIETILTLLLLGALLLFPDSMLRRREAIPSRPSLRWRNPLISLAVAGGAFLVAIGVFSQPSTIETVATRQIELAEEAHAKDVVTAILADFRGLDTMGEISVIMFALIGMIALLRKREEEEEDT